MPRSYYALGPDQYQPGDIVRDRLSGEHGVVRSVARLAGGAAVLSVYYAGYHKLKDVYVAPNGSCDVDMVRPYNGVDPRGNRPDPRSAATADSDAAAHSIDIRNQASPVAQPREPRSFSRTASPADVQVRPDRLTVSFQADNGVRLEELVQRLKSGHPLNNQERSDILTLISRYYGKSAADKARAYKDARLGEVLEAIQRQVAQGVTPLSQRAAQLFDRERFFHPPVVQSARNVDPKPMFVPRGHEAPHWNLLPPGEDRATVSYRSDWNSRQDRILRPDGSTIVHEVVDGVPVARRYDRYQWYKRGNWGFDREVSFQVPRAAAGKGVETGFAEAKEAVPLDYFIKRSMSYGPNSRAVDIAMLDREIGRALGFERPDMMDAEVIGLARSVKAQMLGSLRRQGFGRKASLTDIALRHAVYNTGDPLELLYQDMEAEFGEHRLDLSRHLVKMAREDISARRRALVSGYDIERLRSYAPGAEYAPVGQTSPVGTSLERIFSLADQAGNPAIARQARDLRRIIAAPRDLVTSYYGGSYTDVVRRHTNALADAIEAHLRPLRAGLNAEADLLREFENRMVVPDRRSDTVRLEGRAEPTHAVGGNWYSAEEFEARKIRDAATVGDAIAAADAITHPETAMAQAPKPLGEDALHYRQTGQEYIGRLFERDGILHEIVGFNPNSETAVQSRPVRIEGDLEIRYQMPGNMDQDRVLRRLWRTAAPEETGDVIEGEAAVAGSFQAPIRMSGLKAGPKGGAVLDRDMLLEIYGLEPGRETRLLRMRAASLAGGDLEGFIAAQRTRLDAIRSARSRALEAAGVDLEEEAAEGLLGAAESLRRRERFGWGRNAGYRMTGRARQLPIDPEKLASVMRGEVPGVETEEIEQAARVEFFNIADRMGGSFASVRRFEAYVRGNLRSLVTRHIRDARKSLGRNVSLETHFAGSSDMEDGDRTIEEMFGSADVDVEALSEGRIGRRTVREGLDSFTNWSEVVHGLDAESQELLGYADLLDHPALGRMWARLETARGAAGYTSAYRAAVGDASAIFSDAAERGAFMGQVNRNVLPGRIGEIVAGGPGAVTQQMEELEGLLPARVAERAFEQTPAGATAYLREYMQDAGMPAGRINGTLEAAATEITPALQHAAWRRQTGGEAVDRLLATMEQLADPQTAQRILDLPAFKYGGARAAQAAQRDAGDWVAQGLQRAARQLDRMRIRTGLAWLDSEDGEEYQSALRLLRPGDLAGRMRIGDEGEVGIAVSSASQLEATRSLRAQYGMRGPEGSPAGTMATVGDRSVILTNEEWTPGGLGADPSTRIGIVYDPVTRRRYAHGWSGDAAVEESGLETLDLVNEQKITWERERALAQMRRTQLGDGPLPVWTTASEVATNPAATRMVGFGSDLHAQAADVGSFGAEGGRRFISIDIETYHPNYERLGNVGWRVGTIDENGLSFAGGADVSAQAWLDQPHIQDRFRERPDLQHLANHEVLPGKAGALADVAMAEQEMIRRVDAAIVANPDAAILTFNEGMADLAQLGTLARRYGMHGEAERLMAANARAVDVMMVAHAASNRPGTSVALEALVHQLKLVGSAAWKEAHVGGLDAEMTARVLHKLVRLNPDASQALGSMRQVTVSELQGQVYYSSRQRDSALSNRLFRIGGYREADILDAKGLPTGQRVRNLVLQELGFEGGVKEHEVVGDPLWMARILRNFHPMGEHTPAEFQTAIAEDYARNLVRRIMRPEDRPGKERFDFFTADERFEVAKMTPQQLATYRQEVAARALGEGHDARDARSMQAWLEHAWDPDERIRAQYHAAMPWYEKEWSQHREFFNQLRQAFDRKEITGSQVEAMAARYNARFDRIAGFESVTAQAPPSVRRIVPNLPGLNNPPSIRLTSLETIREDLEGVVLAKFNRDPEAMQELLVAMNARSGRARGVPNIKSIRPEVAEAALDFNRGEVRSALHKMVPGLNGDETLDEIAAAIHSRVDAKAGELSFEGVDVRDYLAPRVLGDEDAGGLRAWWEKRWHGWTQDAVRPSHAGAERFVISSALPEHLRRVRYTPADPDIAAGFRSLSDPAWATPEEARSILSGRGGIAAEEVERMLSSIPVRDGRMSVEMLLGAQAQASIVGLTAQEVVQQYRGAGAKALHRILRHGEIDEAERSDIRAALGMGRRQGQAADVGRWILPLGDQAETITFADLISREDLHRSFRQMRSNLPEEVSDVLESFRRETGRPFNPGRDDVEALNATFRRRPGLSREVVRETNAATARDIEARGVEAAERAARRAGEEEGATIAADFLGLGRNEALVGAGLALGAGLLAMGATKPNLARRTHTEDPETFDEHVSQAIDEEHVQEHPIYYAIRARVRGMMTGGPDTGELIAALHDAGERHLDQRTGSVRKTQSVTDHRRNVTRHDADREAAGLMDR